MHVGSPDAIGGAVGIADEDAVVVVVVTDDASASETNVGAVRDEAQCAGW